MCSIGTQSNGKIPCVAQFHLQRPLSQKNFELCLWSARCGSLTITVQAHRGRHLLVAPCQRIWDTCCPMPADLRHMWPWCIDWQWCALVCNVEKPCCFIIFCRRGIFHQTCSQNGKISLFLVLPSPYDYLLGKDIFDAKKQECQKRKILQASRPPRRHCLDWVLSAVHGRSEFPRGRFRRRVPQAHTHSYLQTDVQTYHLPKNHYSYRPIVLELI